MNTKSTDRSASPQIHTRCPSAHAHLKVTGHQTESQTCEVKRQWSVCGKFTLMHLLLRTVHHYDRDGSQPQRTGTWCVIS